MFYCRSYQVFWLVHWLVRAFFNWLCLLKDSEPGWQLSCIPTQETGKPSQKRFGLRILDPVVSEKTGPKENHHQPRSLLYIAKHHLRDQRYKVHWCGPIINCIVWAGGVGPKSAFQLRPSYDSAFESGNLNLNGGIYEHFSPAFLCLLDMRGLDRGRFITWLYKASPWRFFMADFNSFILPWDSLWGNRGLLHNCVIYSKTSGDNIFFIQSARF